MAVIETLLMKDSHLQIQTMTEEQLVEYLKDITALEPKARPRPLNLKDGDKEESDDECPIKPRKERKKSSGLSLSELKKMNTEQAKKMFED